MQPSVTLTWERSTKTVGMEGGTIPFNTIKGMTGDKEVARRTIEGYMRALLGEDFDGEITIRHLNTRVLQNVQSLLIHPVLNGTGSTDIYVQPSDVKPSNDDFLNDNGLLPEMIAGHTRRDAPPPNPYSTFYPSLFDGE